MYLKKYKIIYFIFGDDTCVEQKAIAESSRTWRSCRETEEPVNN